MLLSVTLIYQGLFGNVKGEMGATTPILFKVVGTKHTIFLVSFPLHILSKRKYECER